MNLHFSTAAPVMMRANGCLVHPGDESRTISRADWGRHIGVGKQHSILRQLIKVRSLDRRFSVAGEIGRHIIDDDPQNVGAIRGLGNSEDAEK